MDTNTTLAATYVGNKTITVQELPAHPPGPGQVELAPAFTGICGTDLHVLAGDMDARVRRPAVLGHEMSGTISRIGPGVSGWSVGQPVTVVPLDWDGTCPACRAGNSHICQNLNFIGLDSPGSMQQRWVVPADTLLALPEDMELDVAALLEPTAVAVHDVSRAGVTSGETVLVMGGGPVGLLIALVARLKGAEVRLAEVNPYRRRLAESFGLTAFDPTLEDTLSITETWTEGAGVRVCFEVSGAPAAFTTAIQTLAVRGRLCVVAIHPQPREIDLHRFFWRELTLVGARLYVRADWEQAAALVAGGQLPTRSLISAVFGLDEATDAFATLAAGGEVMKVLIDCRKTKSGGQE